MITNDQELFTTLRYLTSITDMLTAVYLHAKEQNDFMLFPLTAEGYFAQIRELNAEVREYLQPLPLTTELGVPEAEALRGEAA